MANSLPNPLADPVTMALLPLMSNMLAFAL